MKMLYVNRFMLIVIRNSFNILLYSLSGNLVLPHTDFSMPPATTAATNLSILNKHNDEPELRLAHFFCSLALNLSLYSFTDPTTPSYTTAGRQVFFQPNTIRLYFSAHAFRYICILPTFPASC